MNRSIQTKIRSSFITCFTKVNQIYLDVDSSFFERNLKEALADLITVENFEEHVMMMLEFISRFTSPSKKEADTNPKSLSTGNDYPVTLTHEDLSFKSITVKAPRISGSASPLFENLNVSTEEEWQQLVDDVPSAISPGNSPRNSFRSLGSSQASSSKDKSVSILKASSIDSLLETSNYNLEELFQEAGPSSGVTPGDSGEKPLPVSPSVPAKLNKRSNSTDTSPTASKHSKYADELARKDKEALKKEKKRLVSQKYRLRKKSQEMETEARNNKLEANETILKAIIESQAKDMKAMANEIKALKSEIRRLKDEL